MKPAITIFRRFGHVVVLSIASLVAVQPPLGAQQLPPEPIVDPEAYAIYAVLLAKVWANVSKDDLLVQEETVTGSCWERLTAPDPQWQSVQDSYQRENSAVRRLLPLIPIDRAYRLIPSAEIKADDAWLEMLYPGGWQRRPGSVEYAAVSSVGFDVTKTRAMLYVRLRSQDHMYFMEKREGRWRSADLPTCGGIA